ncbi:MAG: hypothetical protein ABIG94_08870 [Pseudomonadota bacterium]
MRKMVLIVALICLATLGVNQVQAAPTWVLCDVTGTGIGSSKTYGYLQFTDAGQVLRTANATFDPLHSKELLAIGLTAMASGTKVKAYFDPAAIPTNPWVTIQWMHVTTDTQ